MSDSRAPAEPLPAEPLPAEPLPALARVVPGAFYGWFVVGGTSLLAFVAVGVGFYGQAVFLDALGPARGWSRSSVSGAASAFFIIAGVAGTGVGRLVDRFGARGVIVAGAVLMAGGLAGVGRAATPGQLYLAYATLAVGFATAGAIPTNAIITRWFVQLRARALAFAHTGVSVGGVVLVPLATWLIATRGLETATLALAALVLAVALPVAIWVLRWDPRAHGLLPDGGARPPSPNPLLSPEHQARVWSVREALSTQGFWLLALGFGAVLFTQTAFLIHELAFLREYMSAAGASFAVSATAGASVVGRFAGGAIADRVDKRRFGVAVFAVQAAALAAFSAAAFSGGAGPVALYAAAVLLGLTIGNVYMLQSLLVGELFGIPSFGRVFGALLLLTQLAGGAGPGALGLLHAASGGYGRPLALFVAISLGAGVALSRVRPTETVG